MVKKMEVTRDEVFQVVRGQLEVLNASLGYEFLREVTYNTPIYTSEESIASVELVGFAVELEEAINERFESDITLTDTEALANENNPYESVERLVEFVIVRLLA